VKRLLAKKESDTPTIKFDHLTKRFGNVAALENISATFKSGDLIACIGPNGAGKTTMIRLMLGLLRPSEGTVRICGQDPLSNADKCCQNFGVLMEHHGLYEKCPVWFNLELYARLYGIPKNKRSQRIDEVLDIVGMKDWLNYRLDKLSKGMKQRIALARTFIHKPSFLLLDEPTAGLDPESGSLVLSQLIKLGKQKGATIFYTSHNLDEVQRVSSSIVILRQGSILYSGDIKNLYTSKKIFRIIFGELRDYQNAHAILKQKNLELILSDSDNLEIRLNSPEDGDERSLLQMLARQDVFPTRFELKKKSILDYYLKLMEESNEEN